MACRAMRVVLALAAVMAAAAAPSRADELLKLDDERSHVEFRVKVLWLVGVTGHFGRVEGVVRVDPFRSRLSVQASIDIDAIRMNGKRNENWVKSPEFFDAARYPRIEFESDPIPRERLRTGGELPGMLTLRGQRRAVVFRMRPSTCDRAGSDCPIEVEGAIRRSDFGMRSRRGTLADKVELDFSVYALNPAR